MDYSENELETESEEDEDNEDETSGSEEDESEDGSGDEDDNVEDIETVLGEDAESLKAFSSDDDPERECCPICLNKFFGQDLGTPESCDHTFCFECIKEWSKNINTCPIDRTEFNYIHMKVSSGGVVLRKVEVKVAPKEPENALEEIPTLCEICHSGDREDRLLLCDGCDLAYHCECLDPPLFYIPIEEWFCPPCSGVFDRRAVAGSSRSGTRRVIPRTRASEAVRSRVQNLRTIRTSKSTSTSQTRQTSTQNKPKKRRRRYYRKAIRTVVPLARTKKDMNPGQKGKLGARGSTVIVTYRRRRYKRRRKVSKRSVASSKGIPSSKQRLAKHLGIGKVLGGSSVPQVKKSSGSRSHSTAVKARLPTHSLFGNKDQLMDFSENFNEDLTGVSSTSFSKSPKRPSTDACPSTSSGINILDSILAGQKILHAKSDKILIKTDGSLILKDDIKKQNVRKPEKDPPSRMPMSIALAKQGIRASLSDKNVCASYKKHADTSKTKNASEKKILKSSSNNLLESRSSFDKIPSESSSKSKLFEILNDGKKKFSDIGRKNSLSSAKIDLGIKTRKTIVSEIDHSNSFTELDGVLNDISSDNETTIANSNKSNHLNVALKIKSNQNLQNSKYSVKNCHTEFHSVSDNCSTTSSSLSPPSCKASTTSHIKREILSDDESTNDSVTTHIQKVHVKQEILSDEDTNIDSWNKPAHNLEQTFNNIATNIKKEPIDPDLKADSIKGYKGVEINKHNLSESNENCLSDFDASQSIIDSASHDMSNISQINGLRENTEFLKVKEEIPSDSEDCSQSLILDTNSENLKRLSESKNLLSIKKEPNDNVKNSEKENARIMHHQNKSSASTESLEPRGLCSANFSKNVDNLSENELPPTQAVAPISDSESEDDDIPCAQGSPQAALTDSDDDDIPCTQAVPKGTYTDSEDDDIPCTQAFPQVPTVDSDNDDLPCTQAFVQAATNSKVDDLPCTQAVSFATVDSDADDSLPCTQAVNTGSVLSKNKGIVSEETCTKNDFEFKKPSAIPIRKSFSDAYNNEYNKNTSKASIMPTLSENELPATQAVTFSASANKNTSSNQMSNVSKCVETVNVGHSFDLDDIDSGLPSTQVSNSNAKHISELSDTADVNSNLELSNIPATQACNAKSQNVDDIATCETQIIKASTDKEISNIEPSLSLSESFDLPPTQVSNISSDGQSIPCMGIDVSNIRTKGNALFNSSDTNLSDFQANESAQYDVPDTQVSPNLKTSEIASANNDQDDSICKNMTEIISNIKQLVNSLSSNNLENQDLQNISNKEVSNDELTSDCSKVKTSNVFMSLDKNVSPEKLKTVQCNNSKDALTEGSKISSINNTKKENNNSVKSSDDCDNEEFSLEKLKEALKNSKPVTPKKTGIHKHLPQVISTVPVKENLRIKPSNKRTFSFEEVAKLEGPNIQQKPSKKFSSKFEIPDKILENSSSDSNDLDDSLPATQIFEAVNDKQSKSSLLQHQNKILEVESNIENQTLIKNHLNKQRDFQSYRPSTQENDYFPATQDVISQAVEKNSYLSNEKNKSKSMNSTDSSLQNTKCNVMLLPNKDGSACVLSANHNSEPVFIKNEKNNATKRKNCFDEIIDNKKNCNQMKDKSHIKEKNANVNEQKNQNKCLKTSRKYEKCEEVEIMNCVENSFSINYKQRNMVCDKKPKPKIDRNPSVPLDCEKALSSEIIDLLKKNCTSKKITIKQEKDDFEFVKPSTNVHIFTSSTPVSCLNLNVIKVEKVDPFDDFLPATQAVNFNHSEDSALPETQLADANLTNKNINENNDSKFTQSKLLLPTQIKEEPRSDNNDDEVSIIELDTMSGVKVKEEIILLDDDDDESYKCDSSLVNFHVDQRKQMTSGITHVSSIKKEKCLEPRTLSESGPQIESLNVIKSENFHLKHSIEHKKKVDDTSKSKNNQQNHNHVEPNNNKRNSTEYVSSNENIKRSKDSHGSKEKITSLGQHASELKRKSKDHHDYKEKINVSKTLASKEKNKTSENKKECLKNSHVFEKKGSCSKDSKSSKKEIKNSCNSQTSKEKIKKDSKNSRKDIKLKSNHISKESKDKLNKTDILKLQPKDKSNPMESASNIKEKLDKLESLPKSIKPKHSEKFKESSVRKDSSGSTDDQPFENGVVKKVKANEKHSERESNKHTKEVTLEKKLDKSSEKDRCSSEKENRSKNNKEVIITLKPVNKKRSHNDTSDQYNQKKRKLGHSLDSDSNSSEDIAFHLTELSNDCYKYSNLNANMQLKSDEIYKKLTISKDTENAIGKSNELFSKPCQATDIKKVHSKQDLKEEIANQVKLVLKPFYNTGLISKEDYKDIMRRSVPKIYTNCHNLINPEKIRKLILNYVSLLTDKS